MATYLNVPAGGGASTPDQAGFASGTSTYDLRAEVVATSWANAAYQTIMDYDSGGGADRWAFYINPTGFFEHYFTNTSGSPFFANSTVAIPFAAGATGGLRVVHAVAAGTMDFYTSTDFTNWTALGSQVTGLNTTTMKVTGAGPVIRVGTDFLAENFIGKIRRTQVIVAGSTLVDQDWTQAYNGVGTWVGGTGEVWTRVGTASVITDLPSGLGLHLPGQPFQYGGFAT